jgi:hypothetical protein
MNHYSNQSERGFARAVLLRRTPPITRRPARRREMTSFVSAVGCIGLFGGDAPVKLRGARNVHDSPPTPVTRKSNHARPARGDCFFSQDSAPNLSASRSARSRRTPRITCRAAPPGYMTTLVSAVGCMRLFGRDAHGENAERATHSTRNCRRSTVN